jgi:DHA2 family methylenomycin A resistance protein-like MFS transporter
MRRHLPLLAVCLGYFMVILDATIVNVALPSIGRDLGGGVSGLQWVIDAYTIAFAGLLLSCGSLGDRLGARRVFDSGLVLFTIASTACALAPSTAVLIGARAVQGIGAAMLVPTSLALLRATYQERVERARAVGAWGAIAGVGAASGPVLGGVLVALFDWRAVFVVNLPVGCLALWLGHEYLQAPGKPQRGGTDPVGQLLGVAALTLLTAGLIEGGHAGWTSPAAVLALAAFVPAAIAFVTVESRVREPMLPLTLFRNHSFSGASFVGLAINLGFYGQLFAISLYFQHVRGYSALATGLALLPEGIFVAAASALSGRVTGRVGPRLPMLIGLTLGGAGFAGLAVTGRQTSYLVLAGPLMAAGFGMALTMPAATTAVIEASPARRVGVASGVLNAARQAGGAIGVALLGTLISGAFVPGMHAAMAVSAGSFLLAALVTSVTVGPRQRGALRPPVRRLSS